ncbi:Nramp family divalent metal transporter [Microbacterium sp. H1-D42]|uniref:Nramp family divalent metal transporter n=1 Tax=Microbacterium sp. H1-D42 TaxID=2925844 RepID=UPI001F5300D8|nr:Nramp family divalent metal transporter [Microbacterium sp. H1-D42]UNK70341.1 Nramp family divalent metal transporter [Microbacterium sp. H1-D42]
MSSTTAPAQPHDPYILNVADIKEPPRGWKASLKYFGPGFLTSAAVVGSGELITATALGATAGFVLLWIVLVSTLVKVAIQVEIARWSISTGRPSMEGYNDVPPKLFGRGWISYIGLLMFLQIIIGQGGVIGGAALAMSMLIPVGGDPFSLLSIGIWLAILIAIAIAIQITNKYSLIEGLATVMVSIVTLLVIIMVFGVQFTPFAWTASDLGSGLLFQIPIGTMGVALAMFGMTGVGAGEITAYSYWCVEKGYARFTGPNDGSDAWVARARGWMSVMKKDAMLSWFIYTISTIAFYILGASVLHPQGLIPSGTDMFDVLARMFTDTLGEWTGWIFLLGVALTLFKTAMANIPGFARQVANTLAIFGAFDWRDVARRGIWLKVLMVVLPIVWGIFFLFIKSPFTMIVIAGIGNAIFLMAIVVATWYLRAKQIDERVADGKWFTVWLALSSVSVFAVGALALIDLF